MELIYTILYILVIVLAISNLAFCSKIEIKIIVFLIILINIGIIILDKKPENFIDFQSFLQSVNNFKRSASDLSGDISTSGINNQNTSTILSRLETLNNDVQTLSKQINTASVMEQKKQIINFKNSDKILNDVELYKQLQLSKLNDLQKQLINTEQIANTQRNAADTNKYKPIKLYSSCIVSNADGSYST